MLARDNMLRICAFLLALVATVASAEFEFSVDWDTNSEWPAGTVVEVCGNGDVCGTSADEHGPLPLMLPVEPGDLLDIRGRAVAPPADGRVSDWATLAQTWPAEPNNMQVRRVPVAEGGSLLVALPLDEGSGSVAGDVSGNGHDGLLEGRAVFEADTADGSSSAVRFSRSGDRIDLGAIDVTGAGSGLTLEAWFKADSFPGPHSDARLISKAEGTDVDEHVFMLSTVRQGSAVRLRGRLRVGGVTTTLIASSGDITTGRWHHSAMTYDGARLRLYLDGVEVGSAALSGAVDIDPALAVAVGNQPAGAGGRHFDGLIDAVRIYERAIVLGD